MNLPVPCKVKLGRHATNFHDMISGLSLSHPDDVAEVTLMTTQTRQWLMGGGLQLVEADTPVTVETPTPPVKPPKAGKPAKGVKGQKPAPATAPEGNKGKDEKSAPDVPSTNQEGAELDDLLKGTD